MTDPDNLIEAVAKVIYGLDFDRDLSARQQDSARVAARRAILVMLERLREPGLDTFRRVLVQTDVTPEQIDVGAEIIEGMTALAPGVQRKGIAAAAALVCDWQAMLTTLLASMKDPDNG